MTLFIIATLEFLSFAAFAYYVCREGNLQKAERKEVDFRATLLAIKEAAIDKREVDCDAMLDLARKINVQNNELIALFQAYQKRDTEIISGKRWQLLSQYRGDVTMKKG